MRIDSCGQQPNVLQRARKNRTAFPLVNSSHSNSAKSRMARSSSSIRSGGGSVKRTIGSNSTVAPDSSSFRASTAACSGDRVTTMRRPASGPFSACAKAASSEFHQPFGAARTQFSNHLASDALGIARSPGAPHAHRFCAVHRQNARIQHQFARFLPRPHTQRHVAPARIIQPARLAQCPPRVWSARRSTVPPQSRSPDPSRLPARAFQFRSRPVPPPAGTLREPAPR